MKKLYVGNLPRALSEPELADLFKEYCEPVSVKIITDPFTKESRGFGFVEIEDDAQAEAAINGLNGASVQERELVVNEARPQTNKFGGGGGGGGRRFGGGGGGGNRTGGGFGGGRDGNRSGGGGGYRGDRDRGGDRGGRSGGGGRDERGGNRGRRDSW